MTEPGEPVEVLSGTADGGLRWVVVTSGTDEDLYTMLNVYRGDQLLGGSGFGGPKPYPGSVMNEWRGQRDDLPWFVMARTGPVVERVVATTAEGTDVVLACRRRRGVRPAVRGRRAAGGGAARRVAGRARRDGAGKPAARRATAPPAGPGRLNRMLIEHRGAVPDMHPSAYVAPTAVLCGAVRVGPDARILFGAVLTAEDGAIEVGARCVVMENAVLRGRARHPLVLGDDVLVGPHAHLNGARVGDGCFLATGAALFPGSELGPGSEVRIHGVVQVNTVLPAGTTVPIGWVAVGNPARIYPPGQHEQIWAVQEGLDFPGTVYGVSRDTPASERMARQANWFSAHRDDRPLDG